MTASGFIVMMLSLIAAAALVGFVARGDLLRTLRSMGAFLNRSICIPVRVLVVVPVVALGFWIWIPHRSIQAWDRQVGPVEPRDQRVEVVAAIAGYCSDTRLPTGERVSSIVPSAEEAPLNASGFVFSVLTPSEYAGRLFKVHHDGPMASGDPVEMFDTQVRYRLLVPIALLSFPDAGCSMGAGLFPQGKTRLEEVEETKDLPALLAVLRKRSEVLAERINTAREALKVEEGLRPTSFRNIKRLQAELQGWEHRGRLLTDRIKGVEKKIAVGAAFSKESRFGFEGRKGPNQSLGATPGVGPLQGSIR